MSTIHCSAPCIHVENGCCKKKDVIHKHYKVEYNEQWLGESRHEILDNYVYCCHFEEGK
jgi:hypothetical protein